MRHVLTKEQPHWMLKEWQINMQESITNIIGKESDGQM